jgi:RHS repeat-associated protein
MSASRNGVLQASFQYDPLGRRVVKSTPAKVTTYTYDGADILRENVTVGGITTTSHYVHGPSIDEPLAKETGGVVTYYHADGLGSIVKETSAAGVVTNTLRYDAWGNIEAGARDGFAFTGREWDPETGLYYYRARYYDSHAGRFLSEDPIGFAGGLHLYAYVLNEPVGGKDPAGTAPFTEREKRLARFLAIITGLAGGEEPKELKLMEEIQELMKAGAAENAAKTRAPRPPKNLGPKPQTTGGTQSCRLPRGGMRRLPGGAGGTVVFDALSIILEAEIIADRNLRAAENGVSPLDQLQMDSMELGGFIITPFGPLAIEAFGRRPVY